METYIHQIATKVPRHAYSQEYARDRMKDWVRDARLKRLVHAIYGRSGIETRHSVVGDFGPGAPGGEEARLFRTDADGALVAPGTGARNARYAEAARGLAVEAARDALAGVAEPGEVTHVVFASCTGFCNPGPEYHVVRELGLPDSVERYTLGFMGCYAAFPALRMARQFCLADPRAVVLVICLELCSLHIQVNDKPDTLLANSLFADGAAAAVVSARAPREGRPHYRLQDFASAIVPSSEGEMAWKIGDQGFDIVLSSYVPDVIGSNIRALILSVLDRTGRALEDIEQWAVHPGGRAILDKVESGLLLPGDALAASRGVLRDHGNMSSATILFVLKRMLEEGGPGSATVCAMAFGPGLTVETGLLERVFVPAAKTVEEGALRA